MRPIGLFLTALFLITALSGCVNPFFSDGADQKGELVRLVRFTFDENTMDSMYYVDDPDAFLRLASKTFFTYTHSGVTAAPATVTAVFVDDRGRDVERPLSEYTTTALLEEGDVVVITGAAPYSPMTLRDATGVIAERRPIIADWLMVDGVPLPLAAPKGSSAAWRLQGEAQATVGFDHAGFEENHTYRDYTCDASGECNTTMEVYYQATELDDLSLTAGGSGSGTLAVSALASGQNTHVDFLIDGTFTIGSTLDGLVSVFNDHRGNRSAEESGPFGYEFSGSATGEGMSRMVFGPNGRLVATGGEGSFSTSATGKVWMPGTPKDQAEDMFDDEDMPSDSFGYEEFPYEGGDEAPGMVADFIADIYGMSLVPGDAFEFQVSYDEDMAVEATASIVVAAKETKQVAAGAIETLRIETSFALTATPENGSPNSIAFTGLTHWIHAKTYLPVLIQQATPADWPSDEEINELIDAIQAFGAGTGSLDGVTLPTGLHSSITAEATMELTNAIGNVRVPAILSLMGIWSAYSLPVSALMFGAMGPMYDDHYDYGYDDCYDCYEEVYPQRYYAPHISFARSPGQLRVISSDADADWGDMKANFSDHCTMSLHHDGTTTAVTSGSAVTTSSIRAMGGHWFAVTGSSACEVQFIHLPSNTLVYDGTVTGSESP